MINPTIDSITEAAINHGDGGKRNPRLHEIYASYIQHMHDFIRDVKLTDVEMELARQWFSNMAKPNHDLPWGEVHMFSDLTGMSQLVDLIADEERGNATEQNLPGPLYTPNAPFRESGEVMGVDADGEDLLLSGRVLDPDGNPLAGIVVDIWQPDSKGYYDIQDDNQEDNNFRGRYTTNDKGEFLLQTVIPLGYNVPLGGPCGMVLNQLGRHGWRPAHIHYIIQAEGYTPLTTMTYIKDAEYLDSDTVFSVKTALLDCIKHDDPAEIKERGMDGPFHTGHFDFIMARSAQAKAA
jgi:hydroxyquinol 1,2-dioxygenase